MPFLNQVDLSSIRTQKAKGLRALLETYNSLPFVYEAYNKIEKISTAFIIQKKDDLFEEDRLLKFIAGRIQLGAKLKARPCPVSPAHGFVETRDLVGDSAQALVLHAADVYEETLAADPLGEMIIMESIDPVSSAVYVENGALSVGPSNDGVTGGKEGCFSFVVAPFEVSPSLKKKFGIQEDSSVFFEFVNGLCEKSSVTQLVQARGGPAVPLGVKDFVHPEKVGMVVKSIYEADINVSLLDWKEIIEKSDWTGTVVYAKGCPLVSHIITHCLAHKIPIFTTNAPEIGSKLEHIGPVTPKFNAEFFKDGVDAALSMAKLNADLDTNSSYWAFSNQLGAGILITRNIPYLIQSDDPDVWRLIGFGIASVALGGALAVAGESRRSVSFINKTNHGGKPEHYQHWMSRPAELWNRAALATMVLNHEAHEGGGSVGGVPWVKAGVAAIKVWNRLIKGTEQGYQEALAAVNVLVDMAHNNGWLLNKFLPDGFMDYSNQRPTMIVGYSKVIYNAMTCPLVAKVSSRTYLASNRPYRLEGNGQFLTVEFPIPEMGPGYKVTWFPLKADKDNIQLLRDIFEEV
jgi:hypothetical protein